MTATLKLPADYREIINAGAAVLVAVGARLRAEAATDPNAPELWLSVRDYEGLASRLADSDDEEWRRGWANILISGQDIGVLDELIASDDVRLRVSAEQASALLRLRQFVSQYFNREFKVEESTT